MKNAATVIAAALAVMPILASAHAVARDDKGEDDVDTDVCYPDMTGSDNTAPCVEISVVEATCQSNGTEEADDDTDAQCVCDGSYVDEDGCQKCLVLHGFRNEQDFEYWHSVLSVASDALCTGTQTEAAQSYIYSAECSADACDAVTTDNTEYVAMYPGITEDSLYYTPTVSQGPGPITHAATTATVVHTTQETEAAGTTEASDTTETTPSTTSTEAETSTGGDSWNFFGGDDEPTSTHSAGTNGAVATQGAGLAMAVAGVALVFAV